MQIRHVTNCHYSLQKKKLELNCGPANKENLHSNVLNMIETWRLYSKGHKLEMRIVVSKPAGMKRGRDVSGLLASFRFAAARLGWKMSTTFIVDPKAYYPKDENRWVYKVLLEKLK